MIKNETTKAVFFETLVWNQREEILSWLRFKYINLPYADAEDIYQIATVELWKKLNQMTDWHGEDMTGMLKVMCRNVHGHWLRQQVWSEDWDDKYYPQDNGVETDYGYVTSETAHMLLKERMYMMIDRLESKDRSLMEMYLQKVRMDKIAQQLGFRNSQVARNRKSKIVVKLCKEINAQALSACASFYFNTVHTISRGIRTVDASGYCFMHIKCLTLHSQNVLHSSQALPTSLCSFQNKVCIINRLPFLFEWYI